MMKKNIILLASAILTIWTGSAYADACIAYERYDAYELSQADINRLGRDGIITGHPVYGTITIDQYNYSHRKYDIQGVQQAEPCILWPLDDLNSTVGEIVVYGLSYADAVTLKQSWWDADTNALVKESNFGLSEIKLPGNIKNQLDESVHHEMNCSDLIQWMDKKSNLTDLGITCEY